MENHKTYKQNLAGIGSLSMKADTGILISFIDSAILDWRRLTTLTFTIQGLVEDLDNPTKKHYLIAAAAKLMDIQEILLLEKGKRNFEDSKFPTLTHAMRLALLLEIGRFKKYYLETLQILSGDNILE